MIMTFGFSAGYCVRLGRNAQRILQDLIWSMESVSFREKKEVLLIQRVFHQTLVPVPIVLP